MKTRLLLLATLLMFRPLAAGTTYFVDAARGNDANPGTSAAPWKTIQKAAAVAKAGDSVTVNAGSYPERIRLATSGASGAEISFVAAGAVQCQGFIVAANYIAIKGFQVTAVKTTTEERSGFFVTGDFCRIEDNFAYYNPQTGIMLRSESEYCQVRNNRCQRNGLVGIEVHGRGHLVEHNEVWGTIVYHEATGYDNGDADGFRFFGTGHTFRRNLVHDILYTDPGNVGREPHIDGFQTWSDAYHAPVRSCVIERNAILLPVSLKSGANGVGFMLRDCQDLLIRNNLVATFAGFNTSSGSGSERIRILNNIFVGDLTYNRDYWPVGICLTDTPYSTVRNNLFYNEKVQGIYVGGTSSVGLDIGNNAFFNTDGTLPWGTHQPGDMWGLDPVLRNPTALDYHLQAGSPCIDAGAFLAEVGEDFEGNPRPSGARLDIGPYEYSAASPQAPVARFAVSPAEGTAPLPVEVDATASSDADGNIASYAWDFGDQTAAAGPVAKHIYPNPGLYTIVLTVTDATNLSDTFSVTVAVHSAVPTPDPVADFSYAPSSLKAPAVVTFDASASRDARALVAFHWAFGDGTEGDGVVVQHAYLKRGTYEVTLTVTNDIGRPGSTTKVLVVSQRSWRR